MIALLVASSALAGPSDSHAGALGPAAGPYEAGLEALKDGRFEDARSLLTQAAEAEPANSDPRWELGWAHWMLDDFQGSVDAWSRVEQIDPQRDELEHWLAAARARLELSRIPPPRGVDVEEVAAGRTLHVVAAGDTMMGSDLARGAAGLPPDDGRSLWADVAGLFRAADVAFVNLEGPIVDGLSSDKCNPGSTACYAFRTPTRFVASLTDAGIDLASLANNHAHDVGPEGQLATMVALDRAGIAHAGRYGDTASLTAGGVKVGMAAAHSGGCCLNVNDVEEVTKAIAQLDRDHDLVILSFHGGAEGDAARHVPGRTEVAWGEKRGDLQRLAHAAIDAGADLVLGHGPHVLRAMEVYRGRLIAYSLGNFIGYKQFGGKGGYGGTTVVLDAELASNGVLVSARLHPMALDEDSVPHPDPSGAGLDHVRELSAADFPESGVRVDEQGRLSWGRRR